MDKKEYYKKWKDRNSEDLKEYRRDYRQKNKVRIKNYNRWYTKNNRDKEAKWSKKSRLKHPETQKAYGRKYRQENREKERLKVSNWRKNNPIKAKLQVFRRLERVKNIVDDFTKEQWTNKCTHCYHCDSTKDLQMDHILPISRAPKGFVYTIDDVQPLCKCCNSKKGDRLVVVLRE